MRAVGIVGLGLIGGSLGLALRRADPSLRIVGVDSDPATRALAREALGETYALDDAPLGECEIVVLAVPALPLLELLDRVAQKMRAGAILTDVCGAKERVCANAPENITFIGGHPMAGTEYRGFSAALPDLFRGCTVALWPMHDEVRALWTLAGAARFLEIEPAEHDRAVTYASHLPYLAAAAVVESLHAAKGIAPLAGALAAGGFRDTTRLAGDGTVSGAASINRFIPEAARELSAILRTFADQLERDPAEALRRLAQLADERRAMQLPKPR